MGKNKSAKNKAIPRNAVQGIADILLNYAKEKANAHLQSRFTAVKLKLIEIEGMLGVEFRIGVTLPNFLAATPETVFELFFHRKYKTSELIRFFTYTTSKGKQPFVIKLKEISEITESYLSAVLNHFIAFQREVTVEHPTYLQLMSGTIMSKEKALDELVAGIDTRLELLCENLRRADQNMQTALEAYRFDQKRIRNLSDCIRPYALELSTLVAASTTPDGAFIKLGTALLHYMRYLDVLCEEKPDGSITFVNAQKETLDAEPYSLMRNIDSVETAVRSIFKIVDDVLAVHRDFAHRKEREAAEPSTATAKPYIAKTVAAQEEDVDENDVKPLKRYQLPTSSSSSSSSSNVTAPVVKPVFAGIEVNDKFKPIRNADTPFYVYLAPDHLGSDREMIQTKFGNMDYQFVPDHGQSGIKKINVDPPLKIKASINGKEIIAEITHELKIEGTERIFLFPLPADNGMRDCLLVGVCYDSFGLHSSANIQRLRDKLRAEVYTVTLPKVLACADNRM